jgi:glycosyltransferase involved in cell wall biosynthesis
VHAGFSLLTLQPGRVGGTENNARGLLDCYARGHGPERLTVLVRGSVGGAYEDQEALRVHEVRSYRPGKRDLTRALAGAWALAAPRRVARNVPKGLDVIHHPLTVPIPQTGAPVVQTLFDVQHHSLPHLFSRAELLWRKWAYDRAARQAAVVITACNHVRSEVIERLGVAPERVRVIAPGVDRARFHPTAGELDSTLVLPEPFVLYPANAWPHKNHDRLLRAFDAVRRGRPELSLVLTGQAFGRSFDAPGVHHLGRVPDEWMPALYRRAAALLFPSLFEGFGLPLLEAMACGCPVACCEHPAVAETVDDAALRFDASDEEAIASALERVVSDQRLRDQLGAAGLARAGSYTWEASARAHLEAYEAAIATGPSVPTGI